jgi:phosphotriesterase-related protein
VAEEVRKMISTVTGLIPPADLGFCQSHEHLFIADGHPAMINSALRIDSLTKTLAELNLFKRIGGRGIADAQPVGCGRMAHFLTRCSKITGVNIIASTGFHKLLFYPGNHWIFTLDEFELSNLFIREFETGMYIDGDHFLPTKQIESKPGVIKTASDREGVTSKYRKLFMAAAVAAKRTGAPILSHTEMGKGALDQIVFFLDQGLPAYSLILCHVDRDLRDFEYHREVAQTGVYLEYDTIGRSKYHSDEEEVRHIVRMVEGGYEDQILLGLDITRGRMKSYGASIGLDYLATAFIPLLRRAGLPEKIIAKMTVGNPARAFCLSGV